MPLGAAGNSVEACPAALAGCRASDLCEAWRVQAGVASPIPGLKGGRAGNSTSRPGKVLPLNGLGTHSGDAGVICFPGRKAVSSSCRDFREEARSCWAGEGKLDQACNGARGGPGCPGWALGRPSGLGAAEP